MKKIIAALLLLVTFSTVVFADEANYDNVKGDFKIFCLGDSSETVRNKTKYLLMKKELNVFWAMVSGEKFTYSFDFYTNKLSEIRLNSWKGYRYNYFNGTVKDILENKLKPMFTQIYGEPTDTLGYPKVTDMAEKYITYVYRWRTAKKIISLGFCQDEVKLHPYIDIVDIHLQEQKSKADNLKLQQNIKQSTKDF